MRRIAALACAAAAALIPSGPVLSGPEASLADVAVREIGTARPGTILRIWPQTGGSVAHAKAYHILYRSTGINGEPIAVSGAVFIPDGPAPRRKRDIVAWAHPTTGVVDRCAPSRLPNLSGTVAGLEEMMRRGFVVAATDYQGLGTEGMHPYLVGISEAHAVLDSVRAARELEDAYAGDRFAVWGHSQGGHAALFAGENAATYAPELKLVGIATAAPATYLIDLFKADRGSTGGDAQTAMALLSWSTIYNTPYETVLASGAKRSYLRVATTCIQSIAELLKLEQIAQPLKYRFLKVDPSTVEPWRGIMLANSPGHAPAGAPVFIAQGTEDGTVHPEITRRFADHLCRQGTPVWLKYLRDVNHTYAGYAGAYDAVSWIADRFRGLPPPSGCKR